MQRNIEIVVSTVGCDVISPDADFVKIFGKLPKTTCTMAFHAILHANVRLY
jgi:hypothetical protein